MNKIKRFVFVVLAVFIILPFSVKAEDEKAEIVSSYYTGENLYVFVQNNSQHLSVDTADLFINNTRIETAVPENISSLQLQKNYIFLIDLSTSMPNYIDEIIQLSNAVLTNSQNQNLVTICGFGERFEVIAENLSSKDDVERTLSNLNFDHEATDIRGGLIKALRYAADNKIDNGAVSNLIIMTDADPWLAGREYDVSDIEAITQAIAETPETIVHSVIFGTTANEDIKKAFSGGKGIHAHVKFDYDNAVNAGHAISEYVNGLSVLNFPSDNIPTIYDSRFNGELLIEYNNESSSYFLSLNNIRNYPVNLPEDALDSPEIILPSGESEPTAETEPSPDTSGELPQDPQTSDTISDGTESDTDVIPGPLEKETSFPWIFVIIGIVLVGALAIGIYVIVKRNNYVNKTNEPGTITIKLEIVKGTPKISKYKYNLNKPLIIGSDRTCDIVMKTPRIPSRAAKIFLKEQSVFIESLSADVFIEGIRIYEQNRIRSGDKITISNVTFLFRF